MHLKKIEKKDILIIEDKILAVESEINVAHFPYFDIQIIDASNFFVTPGFIDLHAHVLGSAGQYGYTSRAPAIPVDAFIRAGITTVVSLLGIDDITRSHKELLAKVREFTNFGINAHMLTGSYKFPVKTLTGSVLDDIYLIPETIGVGEIALGDKRSSYPTAMELARLIRDVTVASSLRGSKPFICFHIGSEEGLDTISKVLSIGKFDTNTILLTHMNRDYSTLSAIKDYVEKGCYVDITATIYDSTPTRQAFISIPDTITYLIQNNIALNNITVSSDAGALAENDTLTKPMWMLNSFQTLISEKILSETDTVRIFSSNPAQTIGMPNKGVIRKGTDADILIFNKDFSLNMVISQGRIVFKEGKVFVNYFYIDESYL